MPRFQNPRILSAKRRAERNIAVASEGRCSAYAVLGEGADVRVQAESHLELCHFLNANRANAGADPVPVRCRR